MSYWQKLVRPFAERGGKKHRVLLVSHEMSLSGAPIQLAYLAQWLQARGWAITMVTPESGPLVEKLEGIEVIYEGQLLIDPTYGALRRLAPQYEAVLANTIVTWEAVQAARLENVPVLWYIHETQLGVELMKIIHMIEPSLELADTVVTPTERTAKLYRRFRSRPIEVVPYGIPAVAPSRETHSERLTFVVIGTYEERKGQDVLLTAIAQLAPGLRSRASFLLAGRVLHQHFYDGLCAARGTVENVELLGPREHGPAMELLSRADVLICPSRDETMPIVLLEAMSVGKPIICTRVGGIDEWVRDGENGLLVAPENPHALTEAITRVIQDRKLRAKLGAAARTTFKRHFTIDEYGRRFASLLQTTIAP